MQLNSISPERFFFLHLTYISYIYYWTELSISTRKFFPASFDTGSTFRRIRNQVYWPACKKFSQCTRHREIISLCVVCFPFSSRVLLIWNDFSFWIDFSFLDFSFSFWMDWKRGVVSTHREIFSESCRINLELWFAHWFGTERNHRFLRYKVEGNTF